MGKHMAVVDDPMRAVDLVASDHIRRVLARELHDRVAQTLTTMLIELENFKLEQIGREGVLRKLDDLQESTRDVLANLREVLYELRGETGIEAGFAEMVRALLAGFQARTGITSHLYVARSWPSNLRSSAALNIYRIIQEALTNVRMHSGAKLVEVALGPARGSEIQVEVRDDGRGTESGGLRPGMGLLGMQERAMIIGGRLEVLSVAGGGTTVRAIFPREQLI